MGSGEREGGEPSGAQSGGWGWVGVGGCGLQVDTWRASGRYVGNQASCWGWRGNEQIRIARHAVVNHLCLLIRPSTERSRLLPWPLEDRRTVHADPLVASLPVERHAALTTNHDLESVYPVLWVILPALRHDARDTSLLAEIHLHPARVGIAGTRASWDPRTHVVVQHAPSVDCGIIAQYGRV